MRFIALVCACLLVSSLAFSQNASLNPVITLGVSPLVIGKPASVQVLVTNAAFMPVPTGQVVIDYGDGTELVSLNLASTRIETAHAYASPGQFAICASYSGDANFAPAKQCVTAESLVSSPIYTLRLFGDSLTGNLSNTWPVMLTGVLGWPKNGYAGGGCRTNDMAPAIYSSLVDGTYASTWMLGQNDSFTSAAPQTQFQHAALAETAWLAIPEGTAKLRAQSSAVTLSGSWSASDLFTTTGVRSSVAGSSVTASVPGSTVYVGLTSLGTTDYTADILIDGVDQGTASPVASYPGRYVAYEPYGLRYFVGGDPTALHTVQLVCVNPGTSGCYVDWIGGNGTVVRPNLPPYVFIGVTYTTLQDDLNGSYPIRQGIVRRIASQLESDGLAVRAADIAAVFSGPASPECVADGVHPNTCGNQIEETVWLAAMKFLATEAQRIDVGSVQPAVVGTPGTLDAATATSGLEVSYSVVSGAATIVNDQLTALKPGPIVIQANQPGNANVLPAAPVQFSVPTILPTTLSLSASSSIGDSGRAITLTAHIISSGSPVPTGTVVFYLGSASLGLVSVDASGAALLTTSALPVGTNTITATFAAPATYAGSQSNDVSVTILIPAAAAPLFSVPPGAYGAAQTVAISDVTPGAAMYYTIDGSIPSSGSTPYTTPISVSASETVMTFAIASGFAPGPVSSAHYTINIPAPTFAISGTDVTVAPGSTTKDTSTISITPSGGFTGAVSLTAAVTAGPVGAAYSPSLSLGTTTPVNIAGAQPGTAILTITTDGGAAAAGLTHSGRPNETSWPVGGAMLATLTLVGLRSRRRNWFTAMGAVAFWALLSVGLVSCGSHQKPTTTAGNYTITISGLSGFVTEKAAITLTVN